MELEPDSRLVRLIGQVLQSSGTGIPLRNVTILMRSGADVLQETTTNDYGEFHLDYSDGKGLLLIVKVGGEDIIRLPLPEFSGPAEVF